MSELTEADLIAASEYAVKAAELAKRDEMARFGLYRDGMRRKMPSNHNHSSWIPNNYPKGPGYPGDAERQLAVAKALLASSNIRVPLGRDVNGVPIGIPYGSIVKYAEAVLAEKGWLTTKMTLLAAQRKETK
jgi:hypothetical protein